MKLEYTRKIVCPMLKRILFILVIAFSAYQPELLAQQNHKVKHLLKKADHLFMRRHSAEAAEVYKEVLKLDPTNTYAMRKIARCYWYMHQLDDCIKWYEAVINQDPEHNDTSYFDLGLALKREERYAEAKSAFQTFLEKYDHNDHFKQQAELEIKGCDYAEVAKKEDPKYMITEINVNSAAGDFSPIIYSVKGDSFLIFTSHRPGTKGKNDKFRENGELRFSDLFIAKRETDSTFSKVENLGKRINTKANDGNGVISPDGKTLYFTICGKGKKGKHHGCSIYQSTFNEESKTWGKGSLVEGINGQHEVVVNSRGKVKKVATYDAQPTLSPDGSTMYFVSDRPGGEGELDIWYSQKIGNAWGTPVNCGKTINTPFNETHPHIAKDGKTMYFASDGRLGFGGYDIYYAEGNLSTWNEPKDLGYGPNSADDDFSVYWLFQDSLGYFASNRPGKGSDDIYMMRFIYRPPIELSVHGVVRDKKTKQPIPFATVTLFKIQEGNLIPVDTFKTDQTAAYKFPLEKETDYKVVGNAPEYLANEEMVSTKGIKVTTDLEKDIDIFLERIELGKPIVLQNIYYDFDKSDLRPESKAELDRLVKLLNDNPTITIQIGSHTDTNGSEKYNIKLSQRRAKSVVDYLIQAGIDKDRLESFGFGESQPAVYPELSDSDEQANRRTEFRINTFNYKPKK